MDVIKVAKGFACGFLIVLFILIAFIENPEKELYEKAVESIMIHEGLSSYQEVLDSFPDLKNIKSKMKRITYLSSSIHGLTGGPAPNVSREESLQIQEYGHEVRLLRSSVKEKLTQLIATYAENEP